MSWVCKEKDKECLVYVRRNMQNALGMSGEGHRMPWVCKDKDPECLGYVRRKIQNALSM
jgi:hypothetical protein